MIALSDAQAYVLDRCERLAASDARVASSLGLVLAAPVLSGEAIPSFDNTAMDGFAVRSADTAGAPVDLTIVGTIPAGVAADFAVGSGQAARIMTGAPIPDGADAVVMVERTELIDDDTVRVEIAVDAANHVRRAGDDISPGELVFAENEVISPGHIGVLASLGCESVSAYRRPTVAVMSTGDELREGSATLAPGQIRDSNRPTLLALLKRMGINGVDLGLIADTEEDIEAAMHDGVSRCDAIISSGGVSMGDYDYVKVVLDRIGDMRWMQVAIKPAKPLAFGTVGGVPVFGLPGNPVSSMVSFELFAKPALHKMMGNLQSAPVTQPARAVSSLRRHADGKIHFMRVVATLGDDGVFEVESAGGQGSHQLLAMARANALAVVPDGEGIAEGGVVDIIMI
ncbi:MAG: molybdopterin molybdotransferase MoeA [Acidobacteria bacterium]|nr:molybdopterin molybdotransferase MoeA [Acidobacteriota bacterium]